MAKRRLTPAKSASRNHTRVIYNYDFVAEKQIGQFSELAVLKGASGAIEEQHSRGIAFGEGPLRNVSGGQVVLKLTQVHGVTWAER